MTVTLTRAGSPWEVDPRDFPTKGSVEDAIRFCLNYAILAPSSHNTQPWWFRLEDDNITVGLDVSRGLAVSDPLDRQATMSSGAAALNLRVALAHFGLAVSTQQFPDPVDPEACVRVVAHPDGDVDGELGALFGALTARHTSHAAFEPEAIDQAVLDGLIADASSEDARLHVFVREADRTQIAGLVSDGDRVQMADRAFRRELASWLRRPGSRQSDGIHGYLVGSALDEVAMTHPLVVRSFDIGDRRGARDRDLVVGSPAILVISTSGDDRADWLRAGQAMERVLLRATAAGLSAGFLGAPVEVAAVRAALSDLLGSRNVPQVVLRVGRGPRVAPQPRRELATFLSSFGS